MNSKLMLMLMALVAIVMSTGAALASPVAASDRLIVADGKPRAQIVIAEKPLRAVRLAAEDLQGFIARMSGATLPIVADPVEEYPLRIYVGRSRYTDELGIDDEGLRDGAFRMVSGEDYLALVGHDSDYVPTEPWAHDATDKARVLAEWDAITGHKWGNPRLSVSRRYSPLLDIWDADDRGSLNAVYEFLRDLGMRWYFPGELGQVIPEHRDIALPRGSRTVEPDFAVRHMFIYYMEFFEARRGNEKAADKVRWLLWLGVNPKQEAWGNSSGHGLVGITGRPEVQEAHPEFYALWGGERASAGRYGGGQCLSSPGLFSQFLDYARIRYDHYGDRMVSAGPADSYLSLCQCELCVGKATPERGWNGQLSDYVWDFANRAAVELYKTHPDRRVSNIAYSTYQQPPLKIDQLSPNMALIFCRWRSGMHDAKARAEFHELLDAWLAKLPSKEFYTWDYYRHGVPGSAQEGVPVYFPRTIAEDLRHLKSRGSSGEYIEVYGNRSSAEQPWHELATMHLNCYVTARLWWDTEADVDAMLEEYYATYYGPAQSQMKSFIEYAEANWMNVKQDYEIIDGLFSRLAAAQQAAPAGTRYRERIDLVAGYIDRLHQLRERLAKGRDENPKVRALGRGKPGMPPIELDGKLDDPFWDGVPVHSLAQLQTGAEPAYPTTFRVAWHQDALYFGIRATGIPNRSPEITSSKHDDTNIWEGEVIEILLETQVRSYYQIAINGAGVVTDLDRTRGFGLGWSSNAEAATSVDDAGWTLEVRLPTVMEGQADVDPLNGIAGRKPHPTYPWYFNVCRQRVEGDFKESSAFSPTGTSSFHDPLKFAELIVP